MGRARVAIDERARQQREKRWRWVAALLTGAASFATVMHVCDAVIKVRYSEKIEVSRMVVFSGVAVEPQKGAVALTKEQRVANEMQKFAALVKEKENDERTAVWGALAIGLVISLLTRFGLKVSQH